MVFLSVSFLKKGIINKIGQVLTITANDNTKVPSEDLIKYIPASKKNNGIESNWPWRVDIKNETGFTEYIKAFFKFFFESK